MSAVTGVLQDLVRRRLWPVAVLLIVAAVAAPVLLAADPAPVPPPVAAGAAAGTETQPIASLVDDFSADARRRVLGVAKDPFAPSGRHPRPRAATAVASAARQQGSDRAAGASEGKGSASGGSASGGSASGGSGSAPGTGGASPVAGPFPPVSPEPIAGPGADGQPTETYALHALKVRWDDGEPRQLKRLEPLPDADTPAVIYLGLLKDAKTAVFLLDAGVTTEGDGACRPSPEDCQRVHLRKGETQFFTVAGEDGDGSGAGMAGEHQLDLVSIATRRTTSAASARRSYAASSKAGRKALRGRTARVGRLRYDAGTGLLNRISVQAHRAAVARFARAVRIAALPRATPAR